MLVNRLFTGSQFEKNNGLNDTMNYSRRDKIEWKGLQRGLPALKQAGETGR